MADPERRRRRILTGLFVVYLVLLVWVILWKLAAPSIGAAALLPRPIKLIPFVASGDAGASAPDEVVANVLFFVPFGLYLRALAPSWRWWQAAPVFLGSSLLLETAQHLLSTGSFDTTDVITNTAGGILGFGLLTLLRRRLGGRTSVVLLRVMLVATVLALIGVAIFLAIPLHYSPQPDVVVPLPSPRR